MVLIKMLSNGNGSPQQTATAALAPFNKQRRTPAAAVPPPKSRALPDITRHPLVIHDGVIGRFNHDTGKWFCYLVKQLGGFSKNEANIKMASNPYYDMGSHHVGDTNDKTAKLGKGFWQIEMIIGELDDEKEADQVRQNWLSTSRGLPSRRERGIKIAMELRERRPGRRVFCFDKRLVPIPLNPYLRRVNLDYLSVDDENYWKLITAVAMRETACKRGRFR